jgi:hypothetical protein
MIPPVVRWRVRIVRDGKTVAEAEVLTVSRLFARWLALERFPVGYAIGAQVKVSRILCPSAVPGCAAADYSSPVKFLMK